MSQLDVSQMNNKHDPVHVCVYEVNMREQKSVQYEISPIRLEKIHVIYILMALTSHKTVCDTGHN